MPPKRREIPLVNIYVMTLKESEARRTPFLHFALAEGEMLYCKERYRFQPPRKLYNLRAAYSDAKLCYDMFWPLGKRFRQQAGTALTRHADKDIRMAAYSMAQAAVLYYKVLYYVYHNQEFDKQDLLLLHERTKTLSSELMLLFDDTHVEHMTTLPRLRGYMDQARYDPKFTTNPFILERDLERIVDMEKIVETSCMKRLERYKQLAAG